MMPNMTENHLFMLQAAEPRLSCVGNLLPLGAIHLGRQRIAAVARIAVRLYQSGFDQSFQRSFGLGLIAMNMPSQIFHAQTFLLA